MTDGYTRSQIVLHWAMAVLLLAAFLSHEQMKAAWRAASQGGTYATPVLHIAAGVLVLALVLPRLWLRRRWPPGALAGTPAWQRLAARLVHGGLYLLMLALPLTGAAAWFLDLHDAGEVHEVLFNLGLALFGLHIAAVLLHQIQHGGGLLQRMWVPRRDEKP